LQLLAWLFLFPPHFGMLHESLVQLVGVCSLRCVLRLIIESLGNFSSQTSSLRSFSHALALGTAFPLFPSIIGKGRCTHKHKRSEIAREKCALVDDKLSENLCVFPRHPREISCACDGLLINTTRENGEMESPFVAPRFLYPLSVRFSPLSIFLPS
jgi:hypothetical protein